MKQIAKAVAILAIAALCASAAWAAEGGNPKKGKYLYKKTCKSCHVEGAEGGNLTPMTKTMSQWDRFFEKAQHPKAEAWKDLKEQDIKDINQFLYDHALDSSQPETCG
ncbi:c-type cytochrome [Desulfuromonas versatilis]|uniref:C-type cytochrome n=1 Tax=Desulfuromonas versatilis TaxID=2802975 RepID=A0ABN6DUE4_9BACT|nr:cytochrome c [Desulfuromonas versatilis]BCR03720.1 c-type cytochrome [Desulfuromonas versatilis]